MLAIMPRMSAARHSKELARADRVLPGLWRLRLPLPWPGVPHVNAWAIAAGSGIVLVDTGLSEPGALRQLELALDQAGLRLEHIRLLVCTHAHSDHYGLAASILEASGCELWMHPNHSHMTKAAQDPERMLERRLEVARQSGVPASALEGYESARRGAGLGVAEVVLPDRDLVEGVEVETDLGTWRTYETPGHAPSHVVLHQPERELMLSGDHIIGRVSLYYDYGYSPDPAGEFLHSLDLVQELDARLCLSGHGRTFTDVQAHINANRTLVRERLGKVEEVIRAEPGITAYEAIPKVYGAEITALNANWWLSETLSYLRHLEVTGRLERIDGTPERWAVAS
jgi:glyoxylase-like metal-dependent hydrolase (beta-lactamase superfamily II)